MLIHALRFSQCVHQLHSIDGAQELVGRVEFLAYALKMEDMGGTM